MRKWLVLCLWILEGEVFAGSEKSEEDCHENAKTNVILTRLVLDFLVQDGRSIFLYFQGVPERCHAN